MVNGVFDGILETFLTNANKSLSEYRSHCKSIGSHINGKYDFNPKFDNERSIASSMSNYFYLSIKSEFKEYQTNYINEFAIKMKNPITKDKLDEIKKEHGLMHITTPERSLEFFYPDALFHVFCETNAVDIFVEYKITSKFILTKLAFDFLKYLAYTSNSRSDSFFVYISLDKNINSCTEASSDSSTESPKLYYISDKNFYKEFEKLDSSYCFFAYNGKKSTEINDLSLVKLEVLGEINKTVEKEEDSISENDIIYAKNFSNDPFVDNIDKFAENVISSERIKNNYIKISNLRKMISLYAKHNTISLSRECKISFEIFSGESLMENDKKSEVVVSIASYFNNQMKRILGQVKRNVSVFNYSYKRANWILMVIAQFLENNGINDDNLHFKIKDFCESEQDAEEVTAILKNAYENDKYKENINSLAFSLIYYITEVYPIIFDISDDKINMKSEYKAYKTKKTLIQLIHDFKRIKSGKKRSRKESWETINVEEEMLEIAISIFNEYA